MRYIFRAHALRRMIERDIDQRCIKQVIEQGEIIEEYPDDHPYPSSLMMGWCGDRPVHVVCAKAKEVIFVITVYEPDRAMWEKGFTQRKKV